MWLGYKARINAEQNYRCVLKQFFMSFKKRTSSEVVTERVVILLTNHNHNFLPCSSTFSRSRAVSGRPFNLPLAVTEKK